MKLKELEVITGIFAVASLIFVFFALYFLTIVCLVCFIVSLIIRNKVFDKEKNDSGTKT
jgi:tellurite resistance protein TehA-like permease